MPTVIVTGSGGLIGSESVAHFVRAGYDVVGIENDMRSRFFGPEASTARTTERLLDEPAEFRSEELDIRDAEGVRGSSSATAATSSSSSTPPRSPRTTGRRRTRTRTSASTPTAR